MTFFSKANVDSVSSSKVNRKNVLNFIAYIVNIIITYGVGTLGWVGNGTNGELSAKYQTIVTPNSSAFIIWAVIFVFQGIFAVVQLLPRFRAVPMVQEGVSYWYCIICALQITWTFAFAFEVIPFSLIMMLLLWTSLISLLYSQYYTKSDGSILEFWLLRFPFSVHAGWITAASALNINVQVVSMDQPADLQLAVAIIALAVLHAVSVWVIFNIPKPLWTIACVLSWAFGWIYVELQDPNDLIWATFSQDIIKGVGYAAIAVSFIILFQIVIRILLFARQSYSKEDSDGTQEGNGSDVDNVGSDGLVAAKV